MACATIVEELTSIRSHSLPTLVPACRARDDGLLQHPASFLVARCGEKDTSQDMKFHFLQRTTIAIKTVRVELVLVFLNARYRECPARGNRGPFGPSNAKRCRPGRAPSSGGRAASSGRLQDDARLCPEPRGMLLFQVLPIEAA